MATAANPFPSAPRAEMTSPLPGARPALILLLIINLFNYIDRYVLAVNGSSIRKDLLAGDDWAGFKMGALAMAFLVSYMVLAPLFGLLADRMARWWLIGIGVVLWSLASGGSGLATGYVMLFVTRCFVGVGEAAYGPVAPTLIADLYPVKIRGSVLAWFYAAIPVGSALGFALGGQVGAYWGWRWAFYLVVPPGLILGLLCFFKREPRRGQADAGSVPPEKPVGLEGYRGLLRIRSYVLNTLGMAAMTFALGGLGWWMEAFLDEVGAAPVAGIVPGTLFGVILVVAGLLATLSGGYVGDMLRGRFPGSYFLVSGITMIIGFPLLLLVLITPFPACWMVIFLAVFCLFFNTGPTNTILANVTHPSVRASAFALNIFVIHILGDVISPPIIGLIQDLTKTKTLKPGFFLVAIMTLVGGVLWLWGARYLEEDTRLAPTRL